MNADTEQKNKEHVYNMNVITILQNTIQSLNNIIDDVIYMSLPADVGLKTYIMEILDIMTRDDRLLYTGIMFALIAIIIMILDYFNF